jgi:hypothetical protein
MTEQELLKKYLHYDQFEGLFSVKVETVGRKTGDIVGYKHKGHIRIALLGEHFEAGRLAFLYMTGEFPKGIAEHKDQNGYNNAWENLRDATISQNGFNRTAQSNSKTGVKGVSFCKQTGKYAAELMVQGKKIRLGRFTAIEEAETAVTAARNLHHKEFACHDRL